MASVANFVQCPSEELFNSFHKEQLVELAEQYGVDLGEKRLKKEIKGFLKSVLIEKHVLPSTSVSIGESQVSPSVVLTFEQQKELLLLQIDRGKLDMERERLRQSLEKEKLELEQYRLDLIKTGKLGGTAVLDEPAASSTQSSKMFDLVRNLRIVPKFDERDPDTFFCLFERLANGRGWPEADQVVMLQSVFTGKAQEAYSALNAVESKSYTTDKEAVLKAYELVPEAYRQRFRAWQKSDKQSHIEFARDLTKHFNRWYSALEITTFEELCDAMVLEQFKNCIPPEVATHIAERGVKTAPEAATLADEYVLAHAGKLGKNSFQANAKVTNHTAKMSPFEPSKFNRGPRFGGLGLVCNYCHEKGHWKSDCPVLKSKSRTVGKYTKPVALSVPVKHIPVVSEQVIDPVKPENFVSEQVIGTVKPENFAGFEAFVSDGFVALQGSDCKVPVKILRDTGARDSFILASVLPFSPDSDTGECVLVQGMGLVTLCAPLHKATLSCGLVNGDIQIGVRPALPIDGIDVILGNDLAGNRVWADGVPPAEPNIMVDETDDGEKEFPDVFVSCAVTRAMSKANSSSSDEEENNETQLHVPGSLPVSQQELISEQRSDDSLSDMFDQVRPCSEAKSAASGYFLQNKVLVRKWVPQGMDCVGDPVIQIVVPTKYRNDVLKCSHDQSGHLGVGKTYRHILRYFFWPRLKRDVAAYIRTCHTCQLTGKPNQCIKPAPLFPIPAVDKPFEHLIIDCVGPLPRSKSGSEYLLTVMCQVTRYPAAYPLRTITAKSVVKALTQFIAIFGIPKIIQSDQGSNFSSRLFAQVLKQLNVKHYQASAYHAQSQGALERFHQSLKSLLCSYCTEMSRDWEEGLPWLLLAAREVCQESTGFSPNDLVFGHKVRGPLAVLCDEWLAEEPPSNLIDYINGFRHRLYMAGELAKQRLEKAQVKMKHLYDKRSEKRQFSEGDQVLALLPVVGSPFQAKFAGPYTVVSQLSELNYLIATPDRRKRNQLCHINLLKPYYARTPAQVKADTSDVAPLAVGSVLTSCTLGQSSLGGEEDVAAPDDSVLRGRLKNSETLQNLGSLLAHLSADKQSELIELIKSYPSLFHDTPSRTTLIKHDIDVGDAKPIRQRFYRVSEEKRKVLDSEVKYMLENHIAVPSSSSWASPCLLVEKSDKSPRCCTDFRKVNAVTKPDSFPLPRIEDCIDQVGAAKYVSKFDLLKGYWQVPLTPRAQEISAFITPSGLYSYTVMGFGLRNAPATFQRLMNMVVNGLEGCAVYLDDVVVYSDSWEDHLSRIQALFERLADGNLTVNLAKCEFAKATVTYLGKVVGQGHVRPVDAKVSAINEFPAPTTKKELMRFLGLVGYYRCFCRNFSTVVTPLTDLLKAKSKFVWSESCQEAFCNVKALLCSAPVLLAPRCDQPFTLHVDASHVGSGAILLQANRNGVERPVSFFSKKFTCYQRNYSVVEKEALALILALQHFHVYLDSGMPIKVLTDHNPLIFLNSLQNPNQRLMRWALFLQPYNLNIQHIKGKDNIMADALSRAHR